MPKNNKRGERPEELPEGWSATEDVDKMVEIQLGYEDAFQKELRELHELELRKLAFQNARISPKSKVYKDAQAKIEQTDQKIDERYKYKNLDNLKTKASQPPRVTTKGFTQRVVENIPTVRLPKFKNIEKNRSSKAKSEGLPKWVYGAGASAVMIWGANFAYSNINKPKYVAHDDFIKPNYIAYEKHISKPWDELSATEINSISDELYITFMVEQISLARSVPKQYFNSHEQFISEMKYLFSKNRDEGYIQKLDSKINELVNERSKDSQYLIDIKNRSDQRYRKLVVEYQRKESLKKLKGKTVNKKP